jgi:hypothetical protein
MNRVASLIANLRRAGVTLHREGSRLIVEAPRGVVTPEIRGQLTQSKRALLKVLADESQDGSPDGVVDAIREVSSLLAIAYRRHSAAQQVVPDPRTNSGGGGLANSDRPSVHGVVP